MLIGIDASRAYGTSPTGTEVYSREIISALLATETPARFRLYTREPPVPPLFQPSPRCEIRAMPFPRLWTHLRLSAEMISNPPDVLFVPAHVLPVAHPWHSLVAVHDLGYLRFPEEHPAPDRLYLDLSTRWNALAAKSVIADSNATRQDLIRLYHINPGKVTVVYPALRQDFRHEMPNAKEIAEVKNRHQIGENYMISVGTLQPRKNYMRLIRAFQVLPGNLQLVIVGKKGWLASEILSSVERLNLTGRVKFLEYVGTADLRALYTGACLCLLPSLYEGFGFPILEAQACATPVVCSNTSSLPEISGQGAAFFDPLDVAAMSKAIARVLADNALRADLVAKGHDNLKRFDWGRAAREILSLMTST